MTYDVISVHSDLLATAFSPFFFSFSLSYYILAYVYRFLSLAAVLVIGCPTVRSHQPCLTPFACLAAPSTSLPSPTGTAPALWIADMAAAAGTSDMDDGTVDPTNIALERQNGWQIEVPEALSSPEDSSITVRLS